jgi:thioredoxin reductase
MLLRSHWWATELSDPQRRYGFARYLAISNTRPLYPVPIQLFIDYGLWFQQNAVPNLDETLVSSIHRDGARFVVTLGDGGVVVAHSVVLATGLGHFAHVPPEYSHLPSHLVSHSLAYSRSRHHSGQRVALIGGGQSAVEYAALLHEAGVSVQLLARRPIRWLPPDRDAERTWLDQLRAPRAGVAPGWIPWALEHLPYLFHRLPQARKDRFTTSHFGPAANDWLRQRILGKIDVRESERPTKLIAAPDGGGVTLTLTSGERLDVDHVVVATGYKVDIRRVPILSDSLRREIASDANVPILNPWFETSVPGLYMVGLASVRSFGPLYRFVVGAKAAAPRVASAVARRRRAATSAR